MQVSCATCGEPCEISYLQYGVIFCTHLLELEANKWRLLPGPEKLADPYPKELGKSGCQLEQSVIYATHCSCCLEGACPNPPLLQARAAAEPQIGHD